MSGSICDRRFAPRRTRGERRREQVDIALRALETYRGRWPLSDCDLANLARVVARLHVSLAAEITSRLWAGGSQPPAASSDFGDDFADLA